MKYLLSICLLAIIAVSCKKDDKPSGPTKTELLVASQWKYDNGGIDQDKNGTIDITFASTGLIQPCMLDNVGTFSANGTGIADEGATKCNASLPQTSPFTWKFLNNETQMQIDGSGLFGLGGQFKILALTSSKLSLSKDTTYMSIPIALIVDLKH